MKPYDPTSVQVKLYDCPICGSREVFTREEFGQHTDLERENAQLKANLYEIRMVLVEEKMNDFLTQWLSKLIFKINKVRKLAEIGGGDDG